PVASEDYDNIGRIRGLPDGRPNISIQQAVNFLITVESAVVNPYRIENANQKNRHSKILVQSPAFQQPDNTPGKCCNEEHSIRISVIVVDHMQIGKDQESGTKTGNGYKERRQPGTCEIEA